MRLLSLTYLYLHLCAAYSSQEHVPIFDTSEHTLPLIEVTDLKLLFAKDSFKHLRLNAQMFDAHQSLEQNLNLLLKRSFNTGVQTLLSRGSSASHMPIFWEGIAVQNPMLGLSDLSLIPLSHLDGFLLLPQGNSTFFGSSSIGGSFHLAHQRFFKDSTFKSLSCFANSNQNYGTQITLKTGRLNNHSRTSVSYEHLNNRFNYESASFRIEKREHAQAHRVALSHGADWRFKNKQQLGYSYMGTYLDREIPANILTAQSFAFQKDHAHKLMGYYKKTASSALMQLKGFYLADYFHFIDQKAKIDAPSHSNTLGYLFDYTIKNTKLPLHISASQKWIQAVSQNYTLENASVLAGNLSVVLNKQFKQFDLLLGGGIEHFSNRVSPATGFLKLSYAFDKSQIQASLARNYRFPTLNDLYWVPGGNNDLKPELSHQIHLEYKYESVKWLFTATIFSRQIQNWISWQPNAGIWSAENFQNVWVKGIECSIHQTIIKQKHLKLKHHAKVSLAETLNRESSDDHYNLSLPYAPTLMAFSGVSMRHKRHHLFIHNSYTSKRYTTRDESLYLEAFLLTDFGYSYKLDLKDKTLTPSFSIINIANTRYAHQPFFPMPLRHYRFTLTLNI